MAFHPGFVGLVQSRWKFRIFLLKKLPAAYFSGLRVMEVSPGSCTVTLRLKWFTRNPFRSIYFACLAMAAEMSTGILAMGHLYGRSPGVSMLVVSFQADFFRKATGTIRFVCADGEKIANAIEQAVRTCEGQTVEAVAAGYNAAGENVADCRIVWSFKARNK